MIYALRRVFMPSAVYWKAGRLVLPPTTRLYVANWMRLPRAVGASFGGGVGTVFGVATGVIIWSSSTGGSTCLGKPVLAVILSKAVLSFAGAGLAEIRA